MDGCSTFAFISWQKIGYIACLREDQVCPATAPAKATFPFD